MREPESKRVFITDPALATAGSLLKTLEHMKKYGFKDENVAIMAMFGCQSGIERIFKEHPEVKLFLVHMADGGVLAAVFCQPVFQICVVGADMDCRFFFVKPNIRGLFLFCQSCFHRNSFFALFGQEGHFSGIFLGS